jgi:hypothetical protein
MSKEHDINKSFVKMAGVIMLAGVLAAFFNGMTGLLAACVTCYFMLVALNAIKRGENSKKKAKKWQHSTLSQ